MEGTAERAGILGAERAALLAAARRLVELAQTDPAGMSREDLADTVGGLVASSEHAAVLAGSYMDVGESAAVSLTKGEKSMTALVNTRSRIDRRRCGQLLRAGTLKHRYTHFHRAALAGKITTGHIDVFHGVAKRANSIQVAAAEKDLCALAVLCTPEEFRRHLATWEAAADPDEHLDEFIRAQAHRNMSWAKDLFGNIHMQGTLEPVAGEQVVDAILNRRQQLQAQSDVKGVAANHDALVDLILGASSTAHIEIITTQHHNPATSAAQETTYPRRSDDEPDPFPIPERLDHNHVPEADEHDLADQENLADLTTHVDAYIWWCRDLDRRLSRPANRPSPPAPVQCDTGFNNILYPRSAGGTLIPPAIINQLAKTGRIRHHPINPNGTLKTDTTSGRHFNTLQKCMIRLRDNHCQHPGCQTPARYCDHDHIQPWNTSGKTLASNGQLLCRFHHKWKHHTSNQPGNPNHHTQIFDNSPIPIQRE